MAKTNVYIKLNPKQDENITIDSMYLENEIEETYNSHLDFAKKYGTDKTESFEGFKLMYLYLENVQFDGRKKKVTNEDIKKALEKNGFATDTGTTGIFGGYYRPTEKLINLLDEQLETRKQLVSNGEYTYLKEIA